MPLPAMESLQVQYLVAFIVGLLGRLIELISGAMAVFGNDLITESKNTDTMAALTTGIFGTNSGLIYWINEKVFYLINHLPWETLGNGLGLLIEGILDPTPIV